MVKSSRLYIRDSGVLHELLGLGSPEALAGHPVAGGSWQGLARENLLACVPPRTEAALYHSSH